MKNFVSIIFVLFLISCGGGGGSSVASSSSSLVGQRQVEIFLVKLIQYKLS